VARRHLRYLSRPGAGGSPDVNDGILVELGSFYSGETRKLVLTFDVPGVRSSRHPVGVGSRAVLRPPRPAAMTARKPPKAPISSADR